MQHLKHVAVQCWTDYMALFLHVVDDHMDVYCIKYSPENESKRASNYVSIDTLDGCTQKSHIIYPIFLEIAV